MANRYRIALVSPSFNGGGAEKVMLILANKFVEWGHQVDFLIGVDSGPYKERLDARVNKIVLTDIGDSLLFRHIKRLSRLVKYFRRSDFDTILSTVRELNLISYTAHFLSGTEKPLYLREASTLDKVEAKGLFIRKFFLFLMSNCYKRVKGIIANSEVTKSDLVNSLKLKENSVSTIYNPIDVSGIASSVRKYSIVACGRLTKSKNFDDTIRSFSIVLSRYPEATLTILGDGAERESLRKLSEQLGVSDRVVMPGFVDKPQEYFAASQVFVQTSLWEGFGNVLVEAMSSNTPVVVYDAKGSMREILQGGLYGKLVPVGDVKGLADAIIEQIENPTKASILREAVKRFDIDLICQKYLDRIIG